MLSSPAPQRLWLPCSAEDVETELDRLCTWLRRRPIAYGYLTARAPLLSNLTVLENLWLPHAWRWGCSRRLLLHRLHDLLPGLAGSEGMQTSLRDPSRWLACRPAELSPAESAAAVVLRAALGRPEVVLVDPSWLDWPPAIALLPTATWWLPAAEPPPIIEDQSWIRMPADEACGLLM
jgi:hypothetical protein